MVAACSSSAFPVLSLLRGGWKNPGASQRPVHKKVKPYCSELLGQKIVFLAMSSCDIYCHWKSKDKL